ncbi:uncharacterized protein LOC124285424 [Haliotis rubra]|uniref:uncharacterized protein LOC124285424 n=1 Tax=Haliotis rubra TaxID=36100 RepID=UPI001EE56AF2|nr:uncharacterized protein LOC124285424 [Haliotis rubra]
MVHIRFQEALYNSVLIIATGLYNKTYLQRYFPQAQMSRYVETRGEMPPHHEQCIKRNWAYIKAEIDVMFLVNSLVATRTLYVEDVDSVLSCKTKEDRNHCFLEILLQRGKGAFDGFIAALDTCEYYNVSQKLKEDCKEKACIQDN